MYQQVKLCWLYPKMQKSSKGAAWPVFSIWSLMDEEVPFILIPFLCIPKCSLLWTIKWRDVLPLYSQVGENLRTDISVEIMRTQFLRKVKELCVLWPMHPRDKRLKYSALENFLKIMHCSIVILIQNGKFHFITISSCYCCLKTLQ